MKALSFQTVLIVFILVTIVFSIVGISVLSFRSYKENLIDQVALARIDVLKQTSTKVEAIQKNMATLSALYLHNLSQSAEMPDSASQQEMFARVSETFDFVMNREEKGSHVLYFSPDQDVLSTKWIIGSQELSQIQNQLWFLRIPSYMSDLDMYWTQSHKETPEDSTYMFSLVRKAGEVGRQSTILISIPERRLFETYSEVSNISNIYIINNQGRIISQNNQGMINLSYFNMNRLNELVKSQDYAIVDKTGKRYLISRYDNSEFGLIYIEEIPLNMLLKPLLRIQSMTFGLAALFVIVACAIVVVVVHTLSAPLARLCRRLERVSEGKLDTVFDVQSWAEINLINDTSQKMVNKISALFEDLKEKERQKRLAEINFLQAQINPHLMYNTLFSIRCLIDLEETKAAGKMLESFTGMLRTALESKDEMIPLHQEIGSLKQYFEVMQFRYGEEIRLEIDIPEKLEQYKVLKFVLQPVVENSIFHGLEPNGGKGRINVHAYSDGTKLVLEVKDDGAGMTPSQLERIQHAMQNIRGDSYDEYKNVGIINVLRRIYLHFGRDYGVRIDSRMDEGTCVMLDLPLIEE